MTFSKWGKAAVVALGVAALSSTVSAQDEETLVKNRVDFMKAAAADNKAIGDYAKGMATKEAATKAINDLVDRSTKIVGLFPAGTSSADMPGKSNAKPDIWSDHAKFVAVATALHDAAVKEAEVIKSGTPEEVGTAQAALGRTGCGGCHGPFREKLPG